MGNLCNCINVRDIAVWVTQRFQVDSFGIWLYGGGQFFKIMGIHKGCGDSELRKCVCQQIIAAAIDCLLCYNVIAGLCQSLNGIGDCGSTRCGCQCSSATFKRGKPLFQYVLCRICQASINIACICKPKASCGVCGIMEHIRCGLINGNCSGTGGRIGLLLSNVKLQGFKFASVFIFTHFCNLLWINIFRFNRLPFRFRQIKNRKLITSSRANDIRYADRSIKHGIEAISYAAICA